MIRAATMVEYALEAFGGDAEAEATLADVYEENGDAESAARLRGPHRFTAAFEENHTETLESARYLYLVVDPKRMPVPETSAKVRRRLGEGSIVYEEFDIASRGTAIGAHVLED